MSIHSEHPFLPPEQDRDPARRLRSRLGAAVSLWTAGSGTGPRDRFGLTVSSMMIANGEPGRVLALIDPDSDFYSMLIRTERTVLSVLGARGRALAEAFAGLAPAPGGPFKMADWEDTQWGPRLASATTWAGLRLDDEPREVGWSMLVSCEIEQLALGEDEVLVHRRGRYVAE